MSTILLKRSGNMIDLYCFFHYQSFITNIASANVSYVFDLYENRNFISSALFLLKAFIHLETLGLMRSMLRFNFHNSAAIRYADTITILRQKIFAVDRS